MNTQALPEKMELKPGRLKWIFVFLAGAAFTAIAVFIMTDEDPLVRWGIAGFFGLVALIAVPSVIGVGSSLELNRNGFTCRTLFRTWSRTWADCSEFQPVEIGNNRFVGFSTGTDEKKHPNVAAMARA